LRDRDGAAVVESIFLNGRSDSQVRQSLGDKLSKLNLDARALDAPSPYEIPAHAIAQGGHYDAIRSAAAPTQLAVWFSNAELLLDRMQGQLIGRKLAASSVCCWPHHFDLASLTTLPKRDFEAVDYLGVGLSPGDIYYDEPYFYVSMHPKTRFNNASNLADVRPLAHTRIHGRYCSGLQNFLGNRSEDRDR
jgi:hypothetical protein